MNVSSLPPFRPSLPSAFLAVLPFFFLTALLLPAAVGAGSDLGEATAAEARLAGRLVDTDGKAVAEAAVTLWDLREYAGMRPYAPVRSIRSDEEGQFLLTDVPVGEIFFLNIEAEGLRPLRVDISPLTAGEARDDLLLQLRQPRKVVGRVESSDGEPVAGARVALLPSGGVGFNLNPSWLLDYWEEIGIAFAQARTDARGRFEVPDLPARRYDLTAWAPGFARRDIPWVEVPGMTEGPDDLGTIILERGRVLRGQVVDGNGDPVPGAQVELERARALLPADSRADMYDTALGRPREAALRTDREGRFVFGGLAEGEPGEGPLRLRVFAEGHLPVILPELLVGRDDPVHVVLKSAAVVAGRVLNEGGEPVSGASVRLGAGSPGASRCSFQASPNWTGDVLRGLTDHAGAFRCWAASSGRGILRISESNYLTEELDLGEIAPGDRIEGLEVVLRREETLRRRTVSTEGKSIAVEGPESAQGGVRPGPRRPGLDEPSEKAEQQEEVRPVTDEVAEPTQVTVEDGPLAGGELTVEAGASIRGTIQGLRHFERPNLSIMARAESSPGYDTDPVLDPDGSFRLDGLGPGIWTITAATATGLGRNARATVEIAPDTKEAEVDLVFEPDLDAPGPVGYVEEAVDVGESGELRLRLAGPEGRRVRGSVSVLAEDAEGRKKLRGIYEVGRRGVPKLPPMPAGPTRIFVRTPNSSTAVLEAVVPARDVGDASSEAPREVALGGAGDLRIEVPALAPDPEKWRNSAAGRTETVAHLYLLDSEGEEIAVLAWNGLLSRRWRLRDGRRTVEGVPAGSVTARVISEGGWVWEGSVTVPPGRPAQLILEGDGYR